MLTPVLYKRDVRARLVQNVLAWALQEYPRVSSKYHGADRERHRKLWAPLRMATAELRRLIDITAERERQQ